MTTMAMSRSCNNPFKFLFFLFLIGIIVFIGLSISHAVEKHSEDALTARQCLDNRGPDISYFKSESRHVQLCFIGLDNDNKSFKELGIRVFEKINGKWEEITAFTNKNVNTVNQAFGFAEEDAGKYGLIAFVKECWRAFLR